MAEDGFIEEIFNDGQEDEHVEVDYGEYDGADDLPPADSMEPDHGAAGHADTAEPIDDAMVEDEPEDRQAAGGNGHEQRQGRIINLNQPSKKYQEASENGRHRPQPPPPSSHHGHPHSPHGAPAHGHPQQQQQQHFESRKQGTRYFTIKSASEANFHSSVTYGAWATTSKVNEQNFMEAYNTCENVYFIMSINNSGHFQGYARMTSPIGRGPQVMWQGAGGRPIRLNNFGVQWECLYDLAFMHTDHLRNPYNEGKPVKIGRDGQELPPEIGAELTRMMRDGAKASGRPDPKPPVRRPAMTGPVIGGGGGPIGGGGGAFMGPRGGGGMPFMGPRGGAGGGGGYGPRYADPYMGMMGPGAYGMGAGGMRPSRGMMGMGDGYGREGYSRGMGAMDPMAMGRGPAHDDGYGLGGGRNGGYGAAPASRSRSPEPPSHGRGGRQRSRSRERSPPPLRARRDRMKDIRDMSYEEYLETYKKVGSRVSEMRELKRRPDAAAGTATQHGGGGGAGLMMGGGMNPMMMGGMMPMGGGGSSRGGSTLMSESE